MGFERLARVHTSDITCIDKRVCQEPLPGKLYCYCQMIGKDFSAEVIEQASNARVFKLLADAFSWQATQLPIKE